MAMLALLRRMGVSLEATTHGFRSTLRTWCQEATSTPDAVAEAALAHVVGEETERAYGRSDFFQKRRVLMQEWADYLASAPATVASLNDERARRAASG
jgi:integrase